MAGNSNSGRQNWEKPFTDALRLAVKQNDAKILNNIVRSLTSSAQAGDLQAIQMIFDRLEGKPLQQVEAHNVNENHYVRTPGKMTDEEWKKYLQHKVEPQTVSKRSNGSSNGKSH